MVRYLKISRSVQGQDDLGDPARCPGWDHPCLRNAQIPSVAVKNAGASVGPCQLVCPTCFLNRKFIRSLQQKGKYEGKGAQEWRDGWAV